MDSIVRAVMVIMVVVMVEIAGSRSNEKSVTSYQPKQNFHNVVHVIFLLIVSAAFSLIETRLEEGLAIFLLSDQ